MRPATALLPLLLSACDPGGLVGFDDTDAVLPDDEEPPTTPTDTPEPADTAPPVDTDPPVVSTPEPRRFDCAGLDPADAGPLGGRIALTFDDGPDPVDTPAILEVLRARDVPATFFVLGERLGLSSTEAVLLDLAADPRFDLANHSWDHADFARLSPSARAGQIDDTHALIETFGVTPVFFRFPYGSSTCEAVDEVTSRGLRVAGWHIDTADWCYAAVGTPGVCLTEDYWRIPLEYQADMRAFVLEQARRFDGGVVLFHDIHTWTAQVLDAVIGDLLADGFTFTTLDDALAFPQLNAGQPADLPYLGEPCDLRDDLCFHTEYAAWCEPVAPDDPLSTAGVCTMPCEGLCPDRDGAATTFCGTVAPQAGQCIARAHPRNDWCARVPGTVESLTARFVGSSGVAPADAVTCVPPGWP